uniref:RNA-binding protein 28-like n=2 Tax=Hirondellea gigas TaxID=1518452 RepID=A0A2P2I3A5_9CRUS
MNPSIVISNLPLDCNSYQISHHFGEIGIIKRSFLIKNDYKEFTGSAQVTYQDPAHAVEAIEKHNQTSFNGRSITVQLSEKERHIQKHRNEPNTKKRAREEIVDDSNKQSPKKTKKDEDSISLPEAEAELKPEEVYHKDQPGRLIIRNVSFQATNDDVANFFGKYGEIVDINFPRNNRVRNNLKGCVFIQYAEAADAVKAIKGCNLQKFLGRPIAVDHAMPKGKYQKAIKPKLEVKDELNAANNNTEVPLVTVEDDGGSKIPATTPDQKDGLDDSINSSIKAEDVKEDEFTDSDEDDDSEEDDDSDSEEEFPSANQPKTEVTKLDGKLVCNMEMKRETLERSDPKSYQHNAVSRDVEEGRTMFISSLAIDTTAFSIETVLSKFGELKYVMLVKDQFTEQPRGTAFAQFKSRDAADACLEASEDPTLQQQQLSVDGRVMEVRRACARASGDSIIVPVKGKDNRNLYLAKEGFIREGTQAAVGVSTFDLHLRRQREKVKQKLLANLHMFMSPTRLCVNNLPPSLKDPQLRQLFKKHAPPKARVVESRVMRYMGDLDEKGVARSRCYGFVAFSRPEDALAALRTINNNPDIFTLQRRPIVEFSIENRSVVNRKKRLQQNGKTSKAKGTKAVPDGSSGGEAGQQQLSKRAPFAGFNAKKGDIKSGSKRIHKHLDHKVRHRDRGGAKGKGFSKKTGNKGGAKTKSGPKPKSAANKKKVKKYSKT